MPSGHYIVYQEHFNSIAISFRGQHRICYSLYRLYPPRPVKYSSLTIKPQSLLCFLPKGTLCQISRCCQNIGQYFSLVKTAWLTITVTAVL
jgi:hypothetical protein